MVKAVFLDVDNTLLDFDRCGVVAMRQGFEELGLPFEDWMYFDTFNHINDPLWEQIERGELTREELFAKRWNLVFDALGITGDGPAFEKRFHDILLSAAVPVDGAVELATYLHEKYTVCVASNAFYHQQVKRLKLAGIAPYIDHYFISEQLGADKPSKAFFDAALASLPGVRADECVMIGDSLTADIAGGVNAGIPTVWFNRLNVPVPNGCKADHIVTSLAAIRQIL